MQASQIPAKFNIPFANNAGATYINPIPQGSQIGITAGAASLTDGFPPDTFLPVGAGGTPPWGRDFNGLLNQISAWCRWVASGNPTKFDATFSAAIGGYPQGALLASNTAGGAWVSIQDNNTTDPNATPGAPGWLGIAFITPVQNNSYISADDTGSADVYVSAPMPAPTSYAKYQKFQAKIANTNLTSTPTLNIIGSSGLPLGAKIIIHPDGSSLAPGELPAGMIASFIFDGTYFQLQTTQAGIPLRVVEASGQGQSFPAANVTTQVTCFTNVTRNTLVASSWNGSALTIGNGEQGLWSLYAFVEMSSPSPSHCNIGVARIRGGNTQFYWPTVSSIADGTLNQQPSISVIIDLNVGDQVYVWINTGSTNQTITSLSTPGTYSNFIAYRVMPVH